MVDPQRPHAAVEPVALVDVRQPVHPGVELQRDPLRVADRQHPPLVRPLDPFRRQPLPGEPLRRPVEIGLGPHLEGQRAAARPVRLAQHQAVMPALLQPAQAEEIACLFA